VALWQWHQLGHMQVCTSLQTDNHASTPPLCFFTGWMPFLPPNQQRQSTESSSNQCFFDDNNNNNENDKKYSIFVDDTKAKKKIKTRDKNKIKINCTVFLTKISDTKFST